LRLKPARAFPASLGVFDTFTTCALDRQCAFPASLGGHEKSSRRLRRFYDLRLKPTCAFPASLGGQEKMIKRFYKMMRVIF
jgi:hypothetical protein